MQAIQTKYMGPTNTRGSRIKATAHAGSVTLGWDHSLNPEQNHNAAARALCEKLGWVPKPGENRHTLTTSGQLKDGSYVHVFLPFKLYGCKECAGTGRRVINGHDAGPCGKCWGCGAITEEVA